MATFYSGVKCFRSFLIRSLRYLNGGTLSPVPTEIEHNPFPKYCVHWFLELSRGVFEGLHLAGREPKRKQLAASQMLPVTAYRELPPALSVLTIPRLASLRERHCAFLQPTKGVILHATLKDWAAISRYFGVPVHSGFGRRHSGMCPAIRFRCVRHGTRGLRNWGRGICVLLSACDNRRDAADRDQHGGWKNAGFRPDEYVPPLSCLPYCGLQISGAT